MLCQLYWQSISEFTKLTWLELTSTAVHHVVFQPKDWCITQSGSETLPPQTVSHRIQLSST